MRYTDTWERDSAVNSAPLQSALRASSSKPASWAMRSSSAGQIIAVRAAEQAGPSPVVEVDMVRHDLLAQHVVGVQADVAGLAVPHRGLLARRKLAELRDPQLDHEAAAGAEVPGGVAEARHLLALGEQVGDRVVDEVDEGVFPGHDGGRHVADDHRERCLVHLGAQLLHHRH